MDSGEIFGVTLTTLCIILATFELYRVKRKEKQENLKKEKQ